MIEMFWSMRWFPQDHAAELHAVKAAVSGVTMILLIFHMNHRWKRPMAYAHKLRFMALLGCTMLITYSSSEQVAQGSPIQTRHLISMILTLFLLATVIVSIRDFESGRDRNNIDA